MTVPATPSPLLALPSQDELAPRVEQRAHRRVDAEGPVRLSTDEGEGEGRVRNVSAYGAFIATPFSLKPGASVTVDLVLGGHHRVFGRATVRWVRPWNEKNPDVDAGVGIEFASAETEALKMLADFVCAHSQAPRVLPPKVSPHLNR